MNKQHKVDRAEARAATHAAAPAGTVPHQPGARHRPAKSTLARVGDRALGLVEEVVGVVENKVGVLLDDDRAKAEGLRMELEGKARQKANM